MKYDASIPTNHTLAECQALVGAKARLPLTGRIVEAGESEVGPFVKIEVDPRWGFRPGQRFVVDVEALDKIDIRKAGRP